MPGKWFNFESGLVHDGRVTRLIALIGDRPVELAVLSRVIAAAGASIKDVAHGRAFSGADSPWLGRRDRGDNLPGGDSVIVFNLHANTADRESIGTRGLHGEFIGDVGRDAAPLKCGSDKVSLDQEVDVGDGGHRVRL